MGSLLTNSLHSRHPTHASRGLRWHCSHAGTRMWQRSLMLAAVGGGRLWGPGLVGSGGKGGKGVGAMDGDEKGGRVGETDRGGVRRRY